MGNFVPSPAPHSPHLLGQPELSHPFTHRGDSVPSALACPANTVYQSCMTPCPASCANLAAPGDCEGPCVEGCATLPGYIYSGAQSLPRALCGCTNNGIYYQVRGQWEAVVGRGLEGELKEENQTFSFWPFPPLQRGDSFVTDDCSQRCTCARAEVLLCEPLSCSAGEICTLGNHTRGCFRGEPRPRLGFKLPSYLLGHWTPPH